MVDIQQIEKIFNIIPHSIEHVINFNVFLVSYDKNGHHILIV